MVTKKRMILFITLCITVRGLIVVLAKNGSHTALNMLAIFAVVVSLGFMYQYLYNPKKKGAFGGEPWWNNLRPIHSLLYMLFAILVFSHKGDIAWVVLLIDVLLGISAFTLHYLSI